MVFFEGYAKRVGRKTGGGSLAEERRERDRDFPLRCCFTVLHRQVTDFPPHGQHGGDFSSSQKKQHRLSEQRSPRVLTPPRRRCPVPSPPPPRPAHPGPATLAKRLLSLAPPVSSNSHTHQFKKPLLPHVSLPYINI